MGNQGFRSCVVCAGLSGLVALTVSGCGSSGTSAAPPSSGSASAKAGATISGTALQQQLQRARRGKSAQVTESTGDQGAFTADGVVSFAEDGTATERMVEHVGGKKANLVYAGDVLYLHIPSDGSGWISVRPGGTDALSEQLAPLLSAMRQSEGGQAVGAAGVTWKVTASTPSAVTYRTHLTAAQVKAQATKLGTSKLVKVPASGEDIIEVVSSRKLLRSMQVLADGQTTMRAQYSHWGPAIKITAPANSVPA